MTVSHRSIRPLVGWRVAIKMRDEKAEAADKNVIATLYMECGSNHARCFPAKYFLLFKDMEDHHVLCGLSERDELQRAGTCVARRAKALVM